MFDSLEGEEWPITDVERPMTLSKPESCGA